MFTKRKISYKGIDASGEYRVLPPTFGGIKSLVERVGGDIELASQVYPERDIPDDESHDIVQDFVQNLQYCDKVERVGLVREFSEYVNSLRESTAGKGNGGTQGPDSSDPSVAPDNLSSSHPSAAKGEAEAAG